MSSISRVPAKAPSSVRKVIVASLIGTSLEWYDFFIYGTAAALVFNKLFFPSFEPLVGTLLAFTTYAVGFVARPLGGLLFGHYGDRIGRKNVLVVTLLLMGIATFAIGLMPTYATLGVWAPILLVVLRFVQGLGLGGEWGGAVLMTLESGDERRRGLNASWPQVGVPLGLLLANGVLSLMGVLTNDAAFLSWGWRVPFLLSGVLVLVGLWIRLTIAESPLFREVEESHTKAAAPILEVLRRYPKKVLLAVGARVGVDVAFYTFVLFITTYVATYLKLPRNYALNAVLIAAAVQIVLIPFFGSLSDRFGAPACLPGRGDRRSGLGLRLLRLARHWPVLADRVGDRGCAGLPRRHVRATGGVHRRDVSDKGSIHRSLDGLPAGRHHRRGARADHLRGPAGPLRHLARRICVCGDHALGDHHLRAAGTRDVEDRLAC